MDIAWPIEDALNSHLLFGHAIEDQPISDDRHAQSRRKVVACTEAQRKLGKRGAAGLDLVDQPFGSARVEGGDSVSLALKIDVSAR